MAFDREQMRHKSAELAASGVFIGTLSWKYEGWLNQLYTPARYEYRGKVAKARFERDCLGGYAEVFKDRHPLEPFKNVAWETYYPSSAGRTHL
jgi:hypothetical protein